MKTSLRFPCGSGRRDAVSELLPPTELQSTIVEERLDALAVVARLEDESLCGCLVGDCLRERLLESLSEKSLGVSECDRGTIRNLLDGRIEFIGSVHVGQRPHPTSLTLTGSLVEGVARSRRLLVIGLVHELDFEPVRVGGKSAARRHCSRLQGKLTVARPPKTRRRRPQRRRNGRRPWARFGRMRPQRRPRRRA